MDSVVTDTLPSLDPTSEALLVAVLVAVRTRTPLSSSVLMTAPACGAARYGPCERPQVKLSIRGLRPQATDPDRRTALEYSNVIDRERLRETSIGC